MLAKCLGLEEWEERFSAQLFSSQQKSVGLNLRGLADFMIKRTILRVALYQQQMQTGLDVAGHCAPDLGVRGPGRSGQRSASKHRARLMSM